MPAGSQEPQPGQPFTLSKDRQTSTIPKADSNENWVYPSQQMFFNAMVRKVRTGLRLREMKVHAHSLTMTGLEVGRVADETRGHEAHYRHSQPKQ